MNKLSRNHWGYAFIVAAILSMNACSGSGSSDGGTNPGYVAPAKTICDATEDVSGGYLCALQPSRLDLAARDIYGNGTISDQTLGFGYHAIAFPGSGASINGIYVHLTGSFGRPYNQSSGSFPSKTLLTEGIDAGYIVIQLAYHNRFAVNGMTECGGSTDVDNCAGLVRNEKITGNDVTTIVDTPLADSIEQRMLKLAEYFDAQAYQLPLALVTGSQVNWNSLRIGGHSQGSGHALYIGKYMGAAHICLLGGSYDIADTVPIVPAENIADWILDNSVTFELTKIRAVLSVDDASYAEFVNAYDVIELTENQHWKSFSAANYFDVDGNSITGHAAAVHDPAFSALRNTACFSDSFF